MDFQNEDFPQQMKLMASMGLNDVAKNRLALARAGGRVQQAIDWVTTDSIPAQGHDNTRLADIYGKKEEKDPQRKMLKELNSMGFKDESLNLRALMEANGDMDGAVAWLIEKTGDKEVRALFKQATAPSTISPTTKSNGKSPSLASSTIKSPALSSSRIAPTSNGSSYYSSTPPSNSSSFTSKPPPSSSSSYSANLIDLAFTPQPASSLPAPTAQAWTIPSPQLQQTQIHDYTTYSYNTPQLPPPSTSTSPPRNTIPQKAANPFESIGPIGIIAPKPIDENKFLSVEDLKRMGMLGVGSGGEMTRGQGWQQGQQQSQQFGFSSGSQFGGHGSQQQQQWAPVAASALNRDKGKKEDEEDDPFADPFAD
ncbi:hypothetical protein BCR33DRAFT_788256 [Rhizoclosmatium globosum]|uniref:UBA domain-containing protein n=1 Tax=Rhizoclosmatium globosum TaxID=329046 RepID=A0A1Y2BXY3_9FUNG|nr:hypothetical protein BCR33DRAFT_788256 [Rhizoclosmatium globosum]|eukprot:ORY39630.1 hypothetical protein BCR33DRAFT_788256 [Rhizoclosmatium globosum]